MSEEEEDSETRKRSEWIHLRETAKQSDQQIRNRAGQSGSSPFALFLQFRGVEGTHRSLGSMAGLFITADSISFGTTFGRCEYFYFFGRIRNEHLVFVN